MMHNKLPVLLCFHGGGTSAAIFLAQLRNVRSQLRQDFDLVFVNAPTEGPAGPGVLPLFADSGPFYWWFGQHRKPLASNASTVSLNHRIADLSHDFQNVVNKALIDVSRSRADVVGVLGFSEGSMVATLLLAQSSRTYEKTTGRARPFPNLAFGVLLCPGHRADIAMTVKQYPVKLPTVHLHGLTDPLLPSSRALFRAYADPWMARRLDFNGGHHIPRQVDVITELVQMIGDAYLEGTQIQLGQPSMTGTWMQSSSMSVAPAMIAV